MKKEFTAPRVAASCLVFLCLFIAWEIGVNIYWHITFDEQIEMAYDSEKMVYDIRRESYMSMADKANERNSPRAALRFIRDAQRLERPDKDEIRERLERRGNPYSLLQ